ncbi:hypothetical protein [Agathobaculum sp. Marseille-P7918]|uniref:hypothetical protein n=1 Tax=Agathobaculum sp. Marseille-P7918 TaxID=2479843 RepID=UPI00356B106D
MAKQKALIWQNQCFLFVSGAGCGGGVGMQKIAVLYAQKSMESFAAVLGRN